MVAEELLTNEWVSATKTRNYINQDPILDWFELYGDENGFQRDTATPKYDANLDFVQLLFRKGNEFENVVVEYLTEKFSSDKFVTVAKNYKDSRDLANGINWIIENEQVSKNIAIKAKKKINDNFNSKKLIEKYINLYKEILNYH